MRMEHKAGEKLFIDFCGPTVPIVNPATGSVRQVAIFVAAMGVSGYAYIEAYEGQDMASWLNANSRCLHFMGGVPELMIPDNLRSAVSTPDRYEPVINQSYQALANHYETVVLPATLYTILCKCLFSEVTVQAVTELDNKAAHCHAPVPQRHCPFL